MKIFLLLTFVITMLCDISYAACKCDPPDPAQYIRDRGRIRYCVDVCKEIEERKKMRACEDAAMQLEQDREDDEIANCEKNARIQRGLDAQKGNKELDHLFKLDEA